MSVNKTPLFSFSLTVAIGLSVIVMVIITHMVFNISIQDSDKDIRNWVSLVIESGIGIFISIMVFRYDRQQQQKSDDQQEILKKIMLDIKIQQDSISKLVEDIKKIEEGQKKIIDEQERTKKSHQNSTYKEMLDLLDFLKDIIEETESLFNSDEDWQEDIESNLMTYDENYKVFVRLFTENSRYFDNDVISNVEAHTQRYSRYYEIALQHDDQFKSCLILIRKNTEELRDVLIKFAIKNRSFNERKTPV